MTEKEIAEIEARANAATPGPWHSDAENIEDYVEGDVSVWHKDPTVNGGIVFNVGEMISAVGYACEREREDGAFIAHARQDIPALIAEVRRLQWLLARAKGRVCLCASKCPAEGCVSPSVSA